MYVDLVELEHLCTIVSIFAGMNYREQKYWLDTSKAFISSWT